MGIVGLVAAAAEATTDPLAHLEKIGIDEISDRRDYGASPWWSSTTSAGPVWAARGAMRTPCTSPSMPWGGALPATCVRSLVPTPAVPPRT